MTPFLEDQWLTMYGGDCRDVLPTLASESVHCVVTSPPYWGLRDYGTALWTGGDPGCDHVQRTNKHGGTSNRPGLEAQTYQHRHICGKCGAIRQDSQLGLEPTPEEYVANLVAVFREVRRVLRSDGTLWLNLGDSYSSHDPGGRRDGEFLNPGGRVAAKEAAAGTATRNRAGNYRPGGLKPKDLVGIPWRVAFALQADGWYLRSDIIWSKPNPMPESVTDRPTKSHEYLFLLTKSPRYYFDADAVREPAIYAGEQLGICRGTKRRALAMGRLPSGNEVLGADADIAAGRNIRSVWTIATQPYPGAHFAVFPSKLVEPCIKAGTSERGVCPECGAPWRRVVERERTDSRPGYDVKLRQITDGNAAATGRAGDYDRTTTGWQSTCRCDGGEAENADGYWESVDLPPVPATLLDPFAGSGTVGMVAQQLSRRAVLIDLNPEYLKQQLRRNAQTPLGLGAA